MATHLDLEEQEQLDQLKHFWNTWGTLISAVVLIVALAVAGWSGYQFWQNRQASQAAALSDAVDAAIASSDASRQEQAFNDLKSKFPGTTQSAQAGLAVAKSMIDAGNVDGAKTVLTWVASSAGDTGLKTLGKLRLAGVLMDQKAYDEALSQLSGSVPAEFDAVVADRRGDVYALQGKNTEAVAEYTKAHKTFEAGVEYRRIVEIKLAALGAAPVSATTAATAQGAQ